MLYRILILLESIYVIQVYIQCFKGLYAYFNIMGYNVFPFGLGNSVCFLKFS